MGPIEITYITIGLIVTLIGLARGYVKELGSTLIILVAIFMLTYFQEPLAALFGGIGERLFGLDGEAEINFLLSVIFSVIFVALVFSSYAGQTLAFNGKPAPPPQGTILSLLLGLFNGYLIAGTLWYYQEFYDYPIGQIVTFQDQLTETAQTLIEYLPPALFDSPVYWIVPVAILLIIRVRG